MAYESVHKDEQKERLPVIDWEIICTLSVGVGETGRLDI